MKFQFPFRFLKLTLSILVLSALYTASIGAQAIVSYTVRFYNVTAPTTPIQTTTLQVAQVTCNLTPSPASAIVYDFSKGTGIEWDDPTNAGKACRATGLGSKFATLPNNTDMFFTVTATNDKGLEGDPSGPFLEVNPPAQLKNTKAIGGTF